MRNYQENNPQKLQVNCSSFVKIVKKLPKMVFGMCSRNCMLGSCENCWGIAELKKHLNNVFFKHKLDEFDKLLAKKWVQKEKGFTVAELSLIVN